MAVNRSAVPMCDCDNDEECGCVPPAVCATCAPDQHTTGYGLHSCGKIHWIVSPIITEHVTVPFFNTMGAGIASASVPLVAGISSSNGEHNEESRKS